MAPTKEDVFTQFDPLLRRSDIATSPWRKSLYVADLDLLRELLTLPIGAGDKQESGRPAKAFDAWIAHELRRAGFPPDGVWPRTRRPRVLPEDLAPLEKSMEALAEQLSESETAAGGKRYLKNRHEEAAGEVMSLRARHPMATMGYAYLVRKNVYDEEGAYAILFDILERLRRPGDAFDAAMLLVADWDDSEAAPKVSRIDQPAQELDASRFFEDMVDWVTVRSPIKEHVEVRRRRSGEPVGGLPDEGDEENAADE